MKKQYLAIALAACTVFFSACSQPPPPDDADLIFKVKTAYINDADLFRLGHVSIASEKGVIILTGTVPEQALKDRAQKLTEEVKGIRGIKNEIEVKYVFTEKP
ncbi:MAG: BON domain-containing protein [Nevskia sp.]|jgi:osmotically-inducible protein OsmY|nr:BON domain-containing protein [Nevskia sp.]MCK9385701.1 BON domain-containing protein [Nevskia sp.]